MVKVVVAVDEDKEVKRGLEEGFNNHRCSIYNCYSTRTEIWRWWKKRKRWTMRWPADWMCWGGEVQSHPFQRKTFQLRTVRLLLHAQQLVTSDNTWRDIQEEDIQMCVV